ncbi:MAG: dehypoxanthine futalosine cyclase [Bacteroidales bacterium]|jgi:cyclic dehypoxanthinyl futalosine synthase|nr:dehypoxanthine futalosine cyclase [Bacteroidales bacterium]
MVSDDIRKKINSNIPLDKFEALQLWKTASFAELMQLADNVRNRFHPNKKVSWLIDRNVNLTNVCFSQCLFCNFCVKKQNENAYILSLEDYREKIRVLFELGGDQLLLQGGMNPALNLDYYINLFSSLKREFPQLKLHALGPPEVHWLSVRAKLPIREVLIRLVDAGLDSLPGAGAEILSDRVRKIVSPGKATSKQWLDVMREAHQLGLVTSATMMFGFIESITERIEHLLEIRKLQDEKPDGSPGFLAFIPWPYQRTDTNLFEKYPDMPRIYGIEYIKMIAFSRILLNNITNIGASWLTVGQDIGALALHAGANDLGSVMIEENVVSKAGANYQLSPDSMQKLIRDAGFEPFQRNQNYQAFTRQN